MDWQPSSFRNELLQVVLEASFTNGFEESYSA